MHGLRLDAESAEPPADLVARARAGDLEAFEQIMRQHERQVLGTALRLVRNAADAQDIAQETFLRLYRNLKKLPDNLELRTWLYRVTVNLCHDHFRKHGRTEGLGGPEPESISHDPELSVLELERSRVLEMGLATLPEKERAAIVLREVEGLSTREVAEVLGSSEVTVRSQICIARAKLRKFTDRYLRKRV